MLCDVDLLTKFNLEPELKNMLSKFYACPFSLFFFFVSGIYGAPSAQSLARQNPWVIEYWATDVKATRY